MNCVQYETPEAIALRYLNMDPECPVASLDEVTMECGTLDGEAADSLAGADMADAIRDQKCWGFMDTNTKTIHFWAAADADDELIVHFFAHEIGHVTGVPVEDESAEERRAEEFGKVARTAMLLWKDWRNKLLCPATEKNAWNRLKKCEQKTKATHAASPSPAERGDAAPEREAAPQATVGANGRRASQETEGDEA